MSAWKLTPAREKLIGEAGINEAGRMLGNFVNAIHRYAALSVRPNVALSHAVGTLIVLPKRKEGIVPFRIDE